MTDVVVVGAGPVGLFAVFACGMLGMRCTVIDALPYVGGQCTTLYPDKPIYDIPAHVSITGAKLIEQLQQQAAPFRPEYCLGQAVQHIDDSGLITLANNRTIHARAVLLTIGNGALLPQRPPLRDLAQAEHSGHVLYAMRNLEQLRGQRVVVAGGGDSALDWVLNLRSVASHITLVHRRTTFRAAPALLTQLQQAIEAQEVRLCAPAQLHDIEHDGQHLVSVLVQHDDGTIERLITSYLVPCFGLAASKHTLLPHLPRHEKGILIAPNTGQTSQTGIYAAGDGASYPFKRRLINTGFAEAAAAAQHIFGYLYPDKALLHHHSSDTGVRAL